jgi:hypothetical protein
MCSASALLSTSAHHNIKKLGLIVPANNVIMVLVVFKSPRRALAAGGLLLRYTEPLRCLCSGVPSLAHVACKNLS